MRAHRHKTLPPPASPGASFAPDPPTARLRLRITAAAEKQIRTGHPWVFSESVKEQNREGQPGELAVIYDRQDQFLAVGLFDPGSPIRVRVLHAGRPKALDSNWWTARLDTAVNRREGLFDERTTGYRLIHGESDGWPGLVLDRYENTLVLKIYTAAWLARLEEITGLIRARSNPERIVLRLSRNLLPLAGAGFGKRDGEILHGPELTAPVVFLENGLRFEADVLRGQKTGFFLDQRENRGAVGPLASGRAVLNAFSFSGGFSLYAARGGATSVTDLDLSTHALAASKRNFALNRSEPSVARCPHELLKADAFDWLEGNAERKFGLVVLDPPSLARREAERPGAIRAYSRLAESGIKHLSPGGILVACSCSAHVSAEEFFGAIRLSATKPGRKLHELQTTRHPPDHPAAFKEAHYLKAIYFEG